MMINDVTFRHVSVIRQQKVLLNDINIVFKKNQLTFSQKNVIL